MLKSNGGNNRNKLEYKLYNDNNGLFGKKIGKFLIGKCMARNTRGLFS
jgi:hypothetical protein